MTPVYITCPCFTCILTWVNPLQWLLWEVISLSNGFKNWLLCVCVCVCVLISYKNCLHISNWENVFTSWIEKMTSHLQILYMYWLSNGEFQLWMKRNPNRLVGHSKLTVFTFLWIRFSLEKKFTNLAKLIPGRLWALTKVLRSFKILGGGKGFRSIIG